ncbi:MAG: ferritin-like domain-containing protein [Alphaproteobacteria bacterium]|nr:ferritin-like domain-containing protein [Alphaproteobacteria bacterium]
MKTNDLDDVFCTMLCDIYQAETLLVDAIPKMVDAASDPVLKEGLRRHLGETEQQVERLEQIHEELSKPIKNIPCAPVQEMIDAGDLMYGNAKEGPVRDAAIIATAQKIEHYEIASYGTLIGLAQSLGYSASVIEKLRQALAEEKSADAALSSAACERINAAAMAKAA